MSNIFYYHILKKQKNKIKMVVLIFLRRLRVQLRWTTPLVSNALQLSSETLLGQNKERFELQISVKRKNETFCESVGFS